MAFYCIQSKRKRTFSGQVTFESWGYGLGGAKGVRVREGTLPCIADGLYSEAVAAGFDQALDLVGVAGAAIDRHKPAWREEETVMRTCTQVEVRSKAERGGMEAKIL